MKEQKKSMCVLSLGLSRSGTSSMQAALQILGYNDVYHFQSLYENIRDCDMWIAALNAKFKNKGTPFGRQQFDQLLSNYQAVTDAPCNLFGPELIEAYPDAKVVLVQRPFATWFKSFSLVIDGAFRPFFHVVATFDPLRVGRIYAVLRLIFEGQFGVWDREKCKADARRFYDQHYAEIRAVTPKDRLLEYELGSGWEPLCAFLGKSIPDVEFPRMNDAKALKSQLQVADQQRALRVLRNIVLVLSVVVIASYSIYLGTGPWF